MLSFNKKINKKGQMESFLYVVITIFVIGIILFFFSHLNSKVYDKYDEWMGNETDIVDTTAHETIQKISTVEKTNLWDFAFLAIYVGLIIQLILFSFATRINLAFYWLFALLSLVMLIVGTILSATWQELSVSPEFATTLTRFPITNTLLGTYYPIGITFMIMVGMIVLFGKRPE